MATEKIVEISSLSDFIDWVNKLGSDKYWFRGVPNQDYRIQASAYRRMKKDTEKSEISKSNYRIQKERAEKNQKVLQINSDLIADARLRGHDKRDGRALEDLEILAEFQHYFAATWLIDFTHNAQIALYFACLKDLKWENNPQDSEEAPYGKVYAVRNDPNRFKKIDSALLKKEINEFSQFDTNVTPQLYHWEPRHQNNRVIAQQSIFLFGSYELKADGVCIIKDCNKKIILAELERVSGITQAMLFPDFDGFARLYRENVPYTELSAAEYAKRAYDAYQTEKYQNAIVDYDKAIELEPGKSSHYYFRAEAKVELGQYREAITDYNKAIELEPNDSYNYIQRAEAKVELGQYEEAITDYDKAIELYPDSSRYYYRAKVKVELEQYEEAIADYNEALQRKPKNAYIYYMRAQARIQMSEFRSAKEDLDVALLLAREMSEVKLITRINQSISEIESESTEDDIPF
ncbi:MAG: tetratricopeptide repeat protein [Candidatus Poribacteria bacterium]|nr:tetratricopeptide repeat protein [Candidatus Poribacteria bacterium]